MYEKELPSVVKIRKEGEGACSNSVKVIQHLELLRDGFGDDKYWHGLIPEHVTSNKTTIIGYGLYYFSYSTWEGRVLFMEDVFVEPDHRSENSLARDMDSSAVCYRQTCGYTNDEGVCQGAPVTP